MINNQAILPKAIFPKKIMGTILINKFIFFLISFSKLNAKKRAYKNWYKNINCNCSCITPSIPKYIKYKKVY